MKYRREPGVADGRSAASRPWSARVRGRLYRTQLRTRVLAGVLAVTLIALASFGFAMVEVLHGYLLGKTDSGLQAVLSEYRPMLADSTANTSPNRSYQALSSRSECVSRTYSSMSRSERSS